MSALDHTKLPDCVLQILYSDLLPKYITPKNVAIKVQHKIHIVEVMFICTVSCPDPDNGFDGTIAIWRVSVIQKAQRSTTRRQRGDEYEVDVTIDRSGSRNGTLRCSSLHWGKRGHNWRRDRSSSRTTRARTRARTHRGS